MLGVLAALAACPSGGGDGKVAKPVPPPLPGNEGKLDLPEIPAKIAITQSAPTAGNSPAARSPILDILKTENDSGAINTYMPGMMAQIGVIF